jgi:hypothetical protein
MTLLCFATRRWGDPCAGRFGDLGLFRNRFFFSPHGRVRSGAVHLANRNVIMSDESENVAEDRWKANHEPERHFFRCPVPRERAEATLRISALKIPVELQESSIDGFAVLVQQKYASKLRLGPRWILQSTCDRTEVNPQWIYCAPDGRVQIGLRRLRDLTDLPKPRWFPRFSLARPRDFDHSLVFAAIVLLSGLALALPGLGDVLGTAPWIEQTAREFLGGPLNRLKRGF